MNRQEIAAVLGGMLAFILWVAPGMLILTASIRDEPPGLITGGIAALACFGCAGLGANRAWDLYQAARNPKS
jgi:hypothetical protein